MGEPIYADGHGSEAKKTKVRGCRGRLQTLYHRTIKGQELYRLYLVPNCVFLQRGQRNVGLLQQICDRMRSGQLTNEDRRLLTFRRVHHPYFITDFTIHYNNESCLSTNWRQLWSDCQSLQPPSRLYVCKASYYTTRDNGQIVDALSCLPPQKYNFANDVLCLSIGCDVRLIKNINVAAGLVNSSSGTVVSVIFNNADCDLLLSGKHPPPYCIVVDFPAFQGFLTKDGERVYPFAHHPTWIPIYREKFSVKRCTLSSWIIQKQESKDCWRSQFPLDLCRAITCHRAQGQTLSNCTVSVDLGLDIPDRPLPPEITSILYVACTRVPRLQDLFVGNIYPGMWDKIMMSPGSHEMKTVEDKLKAASLEFASTKGKLTEVEDEMNWQPIYTNIEEEIASLETQPISVRNTPAPPVTSDVDFTVQFKGGSSNHKFRMSLQPMRTERHIGIDQGTNNFAVVAVDREIGKRPVIVAAELYNLNLTTRFSASDVLLKLQMETELRNWMQETVNSTLPVVDRVVVHLEQMSTFNAHWRQFGSELGKLLQQSASDPASCVVKMSQPHLLRSGGVIHHLGERIVTELKLVPICYNNKRQTAQVPAVVQDDDPQEGTSSQTPTKRQRLEQPVEVDDDSDIDDDDDEQIEEPEMDFDSDTECR